MIYDNKNKGAIWANKKHLENEKAPKWTGKLDVEGVTYTVSAWPGDKEKPTSPSLRFSIQKADTAPATKPKEIIEDVPF